MGYGQVQGARGIFTLSLCSADFFFYNPALLMHTHMMPYLCHATSPQHAGTSPPLSPSQPRCQGKLERSLGRLVWDVAEKQPWPCRWTGLGNPPSLCCHGAGSTRRSACREETATQGQPAPAAGKGSRGCGDADGEGSKGTEQWDGGMLQSSASLPQVSRRGCGAG